MTTPARSVESPRTVVTVSGTIPPGLAAAIARGDRPRADFLEIAAAAGADVLDVAAAREGRGRLVRLLPGSVALAIDCFRRRRRYTAVLSDAEPVGFAYAALGRFTRRRPRHVLVAHRLTPRRKRIVHRLLGLRRGIDAVIVYAGPQRDAAICDLGYRDDQVVLTPFMVDAAFWRPGGVSARPRPRPMVCAAGQELRDYPTLVRAVEGLDVDVVLAAASPWSRRRDTSQEIALPPNVEVTRLDQAALRQLYADATLCVVPLVETDFQAGITTILEAMAMGMAVVCTRTTGQTDTIVDEVTGVYVPPGDAVALRQAISRLLDSPQERQRLGAAARAWVLDHADIDVYARTVAAVIHER